MSPHTCRRFYVLLSLFVRWLAVCLCHGTPVIILITAAPARPTDRPPSQNHLHFATVSITTRARANSTLVRPSGTRHRHRTVASCSNLNNLGVCALAVCPSSDCTLSLTPAARCALPYLNICTARANARSHTRKPTNEEQKKNNVHCVRRVESACTGYYSHRILFAPAG